MGLMASTLIAPELQHLAVPLNELKLWPRNPRLGDVGALSESLKRFGQVRPILVQKSTMQIVAGNHLYRAAAALGWTEIAAIVTDMTEKQAKAFVATDNRMSELGSFDEATLAYLLADIAKNDTLEGTGYDEDDLEALLAKVGTGKGFGQGDPDAAGNVPSEPWVEPGMVFQLGEHRIACGDGTDPELLDKLLGGVTPDLLIIQPPAKKGQKPTDLWDHFRSVPEQFWFEPHRYGLFQLIEDSNFLVWDKQAENTNRDFAEAFELIYSKKAHQQVILRHTLVGVADGEKHGGPDFNERPSALFMDIFERWSGWEAAILDPIGLGATPLLAAEKSGKRYFGAKVDPGHVQATLEKWKEYSGLEAIRVDDSEG